MLLEVCYVVLLNETTLVKGLHRVLQYANPWVEVRLATYKLLLNRKHCKYK